MAEKSRHLLAKIRFLEFVTARGDLTKQEMRVAVYLTSRCNMKRGYAWPSLEGMATQLNANKRTIIRSIDRLEALGYFTVKRGGGAGHANEYTPCFEQISDGDAFSKTVVEAPPIDHIDALEKRVTNRSETVTSHTTNSGRTTTPTEEDTTEEDSNRSFPKAPQNCGADTLPSMNSIYAFIRETEDRVKSGCLQRERYRELEILAESMENAFTSFEHASCDFTGKDHHTYRQCERLLSEIVDEIERRNAPLVR